MKEILDFRCRPPHAFSEFTEYIVSYNRLLYPNKMVWTNVFYSGRSYYLTGEHVENVNIIHSTLDGIEGVYRR